MDTLHGRDGPGTNGRGRDGPAKKVRCREDRIEAPPPASDQAPTTSKQAFFYGSESGGDAQTIRPVEQGAGVGLTASRRSRKAKGAFRGTVHIEFRPGRARQAFILGLLFGDGPPPDAAAGACVRQPRRPRLPAEGGACAVGQESEEAALTGR